MLSLALLLAAGAPAFQSTALLDQAVQQFTGQPVGADGGAAARIDQRLKLAQCAMPQFEWRTPAQDAVVVRCMAPVWRIYVPVRRATPIAAPATVATVAARQAATPARAEPVIRRGDPITIEAGANGFSISREGVAMGDAPAGGRLMVRVDPVKPPVQAVALAAGRATLPSWR